MKHLSASLKRKAGQAASEYLAIIGAMLIAVGTISTVATHQCIKDMGGKVEDCRNMSSAVSTAFRSSIEEITLLINLPF